MPAPLFTPFTTRGDNMRLPKMDANQIRSLIVKAAHTLGLVLVAVAVAKYFALGNIPLPGSASDVALIACACLLSR